MPLVSPRTFIFSFLFSLQRWFPKLAPHLSLEHLDNVLDNRMGCYHRASLHEPAGVVRGSQANVKHWRVVMEHFLRERAGDAEKTIPFFQHK